MIPKAKRPWWITVAVLWFLVIGLEGGTNALGQIIQIAGGQVDWGSTALRLGVQEDVLKSAVTIQVFLQAALSLSMLAACIGMWFMKKWGALICLFIIVLIVVTIILSLIQGTLDSLFFIGLLSFIAIGVGQAYLWRKGKLT